MSHPDHPSPDTDTPSFREKAMSFWEHLDELRATLIKCVLAFAVFAGLVGFYLAEFQDVLMWPFHHALANYPELTIELGTNAMLQGFNVVMQTCVFGGLMLAAPFILFFLAQFVAPALTPREVKAVLPAFVASTLLFVAGVSFAFFVVMPGAVAMTIEINRFGGWHFYWTVGSYYSLLFGVVLGVGGAFQLPLVTVLLVWLGLTNTAFLRRHRRHAFIVILIIAAVLTPSTDPFMQLTFAVPLYILFELSIVVAAHLEKRRASDGVALLVALLALFSSTRERLPALSPSKA